VNLGVHFLELRVLVLPIQNEGIGRATRLVFESRLALAWLGGQHGMLMQRIPNGEAIGSLADILLEEILRA